MGVDAVSSIKPGGREARLLAEFLRAVARPRNADEAVECERWLRRLEGARS